MHLFYMCPEGTRLQDKVTGIVKRLPLRKTTFLKNYYDLRIKLTNPFKKPCAVLLVTETMDGLLKARQLAPLLWGLKILLILPDLNYLTVQKALELQPLFFTSAQSNLNDLSIVLNKLFLLNADSQAYINQNISLTLSESVKTKPC